MQIELFNNGEILKVTFNEFSIIYYDSSGNIIPNNSSILRSLVSDKLDINCATIGESCDNSLPVNGLLANNGDFLLANNGDYLVHNGI